MDTFRIVVIENTCPVCRRGKVYAGLMTMNERCLECGALFLPEGSWTGATVMAYVLGSVIGVVALFALWATGNLVRGAEFAVVGLIWVSVTVLYRYLKAWWVAMLYDSGFVHGGKAAERVSAEERRDQEARIATLLVERGITASAELVAARRAELVAARRAERRLRDHEVLTLSPEETAALDAQAATETVQGLLFDAVAEEAGLTVDDADIRGKMEELASEKGKPLEWVYAAFGGGAAQDAIRREIRHRKALKHLMAGAGAT